MPGRSILDSQSHLLPGKGGKLLKSRINKYYYFNACQNNKIKNNNNNNNDSCWDKMVGSTAITVANRRSEY